jgi:antitoxin component of RelBE/YafQ-DinJ toxin-antitoxin module
MTTARERYEAKTKVVTFRVDRELFHRLEEVRAKTGLSYSNLVKLGAGIADEEIKRRLAEVNGLESRLAELNEAIRQAQQNLESCAAEEKKRRLAELDTEMEAFKLFDLRWSLDEVSLKLGINHDTAYHYFQSWGEIRNEKQAIEQEFLSECLRKHLDVLRQRRNWCRLLPGYSKQLEGVQDEMDYCQHLLESPSEIDDDWKAFLHAEYSRQIQPAKTNRNPEEGV